MQKEQKETAKAVPPNFAGPPDISTPPIACAELRRVFQNLLRPRLLIHDHQIHPPVLLPAFLGGIVRDGLGETVADGIEARRRDAAGIGQEFHYVAGALLRKL